MNETAIKLKRLYFYLDEIQTTPYKVGYHDCYLFLCGVVNAYTGIDYRSVYQGKYSTKEEALQIINEAGGYIEAVKSHTGACFTITNHTGLLQEGDMVVFKLQGDSCPHIGVRIKSSIVFPGDDGIVFLYENYTLLGYWRFL